MLPLVIVNPKSASGSTGETWAGVAADLRAHFGAFTVAFTKASGDGSRIAREACENGNTFIIACGGDGTINEVANGVIESGTGAKLGVLPSGTGGDFRRSLGIPNETREAAKVLRSGQDCLIDVGKVTFQSHDDHKVSRYFLNVSSFGLAASVIKRVKSTSSFDWLPLGAIRGKANFALSTVREVLDIDAHLIRIKIDDQAETNLQTVNFCVANAKYFGGGMKIAPDAKLNDGFFDIINIGDIKTAKVLLNVYTLYNGTHVNLKEVKSTLAKRVAIRPLDDKQEIHIETDGELPGKLPAVYEIIPNALSVCVPKSL